MLRDFIWVQGNVVYVSLACRKCGCNETKMSQKFSNTNQRIVLCKSCETGYFNSIAEAKNHNPHAYVKLVFQG